MMDNKTKKILIEFADLNLALLSSIIELSKTQRAVLSDEFPQYLREAVDIIRKITDEIKNDG